MKGITKRIISTLAICGALVLEAGAAAFGLIGKGFRSAARVDAANVTTTWNAGSEGFSDQQQLAQNTYYFTDSKVSITFGEATGNGHKWYNNGSAIRSYGDNSFTISTSSGKLTSITLSNNQTKEVTANTGSYSSNSWTGNATSVTFTVDTGSGNFRTSTISATYSTGSDTGFTVSFNNGGGDGSMTQLTGQTSIDSAPACTFTAPSGKQFSHWSTSSGGSAATFPMTLTENVTLYAVWKNGGSVKTYQFITGTGSTFGTSTASNKSLNGVNWNITTATNLGGYNSGNYCGQQMGTSSAVGEIVLETVNNWGEQSSTTWTGYKKVKKVYLWLNNGSGSVGTYDVSVDGTSCSRSGTVTKNSTAKSYEDASKVTYTPITGHEMGKVKIHVKSSSKAIYFCAIAIECEEVTVSKFSVTNASGGSVVFTGATGADAAQNDKDYTATISPVSGYNQVSISSIVVGSTTLSSTDYTFSGGTLTIPKEKINGDITITAVGSKASYTVFASGTGVTFSSTPNATYLTQYQISFNVNEGYDNPSSVSVKIGGVEVAGVTLNGTTITVPAAGVTGNLTITANATLHEYELSTSSLQYIEFEQETDSSLKHGETFAGTLSAVTGYTLEGAEITVSMGGDDVTADVLANDYIQIDEVTGDVVISGVGIKLQDSTVVIDQDEFSIEENDSDTLTVEYANATLLNSFVELDDGNDVVTFGSLNTTTGEITLTPKAKGIGFYTLTVTFVNNQSQNDEIDFDVYVEVYGDELTGITLSQESGDYYLGDNLIHPTVTAHYSLSGDQTVTASWDDSEYNKYAVGSYSCVATYEGKTATYTANVAAKEYLGPEPVPANTVLFAEPFTGQTGQPKEKTANTTVYGNGTVAYTCGESGTKNL